MQSTEVPTGLVEPAATAVGPAIGNAIFAAVGARICHLPIQSASVLKAIKAAALHVRRPTPKTSSDQNEASFTFGPAAEADCATTTANITATSALIEGLKTRSAEK